MSLENIYLPGNCVLIKRDEPIKQTASGIFLGEDSTEVIDTGTITKIGLELMLSRIGSSEPLEGTKVRFRESFAEEIEIEGTKYLFFRDLEPSIYYYIDEDKG